jgi:site-specific recombinase XerD
METLQRYLEERQANGISPNTMKHDSIVLRTLDSFLANKSFEDVSKEDLIRFFNSISARLKVGSVHQFKAKTKHFYAWLFKCDYGEYPSMVKWMRTSNPKGYTKTKGEITSFNPEDLLTDEEVYALIEACDHPREQAMISVLNETAAEAVELLHMKVKSVAFDEAGARLTFEGTGGKRTIRVVDSVPYLQAWLNVHSFRRDPEAPLWLTRGNKSRGMTYQRLHQLVKEAKKKAKLTKPVSPRLLRHKCLTKMAKILPEQKLKLFAGWTPSSKMASVYVHLSGRDLDEDILRLHGKTVTEPKEPLKSPLSPRVCPRCQHESPATYLWCGFCGQRLDVELDMTDQIERERFLKWLAEEAMKDREILKRWYAASDRVDKRERKGLKEKPSSE